MISLSIALARLSHRPDANSKLAAAVMNRNWMDRSATCGGGDGCYYCETSGLWHSVWGLQQPQNCSQVSLLLLDAIKLSKWRIIWSVCIFFFLADFTMLQQEHKIFRKQFSRFVSANYCFLCFAKCGKKYEEPLNNLLAWIVHLKIKDKIRCSILDHLFNYLPKFKLVSLTNSKTLNTAYYFVIFHLKNKILKLTSGEFLFINSSKIFVFRMSRSEKVESYYQLTKMGLFFFLWLVLNCCNFIGMAYICKFYRMSQRLALIHRCLMLSTTSCQSNCENNNWM